MWRCVLELTHQTWNNVWLKVFYDEGGKENWGSLHWLIGYWIIVEIQTVLLNILQTVHMVWLLINEKMILMVSLNENQ